MVRSSPCLITTTPLPATRPAKVTTPFPAASTRSPARPSKSTPRCPGSQFWAGRSKPKLSLAGCNGQPHCLVAKVGLGGSMTPKISISTVKAHRFRRKPRYFIESGLTRFLLDPIQQLLLWNGYGCGFHTSKTHVN